MWLFKKWKSVSQWVENNFPKYNGSEKSKIAAHRALFLRTQLLAGMARRDYQTQTKIGDTVIDIKAPIQKFLDFWNTIDTKSIVAIDMPTVSRRYRLRGKVFLVTKTEHNTFNIYGISLSDNIGLDIDGHFVPLSMSLTPIMGRRYCKTVEDMPYWRMVVKYNMYRLMIQKSGGKVDNVTVVGLSDAFENYVLIDIPIIDALNRVACKL